jgi:hypothetical protein
MVNITRITQARTAAAAVSCLFIDFQGNLLTTFANLPYPAVSNIPVVALQSLDPSIPISAGQMVMSFLECRSMRVTMYPLR